MKIIINGKTFESGKITRAKYKIYTEAKKKITEKEEKSVDYNDDDLDLMVSTLVKLYDNQFSEDDINDDFEIADIIFEFMQCDIDIMGKLNNKIDKAQKGFLKIKK